MSNDQSSEAQRQAEAARRVEEERQAQAQAAFEYQGWLRAELQRTRD